LIINSLNTNIHKSLIHNHEKYTEKNLYREILRNISKHKAQKVLHERPAKIIGCELAESYNATMDAQ